MAAQTVYRCYFLSTSRVISDAVFLSPSEIESGVFSSDRGNVAIHSPLTTLGVLKECFISQMIICMSVTHPVIR